MPDSPPAVRLGRLEARGLAPAIMAIVERGTRLRPRQARALSAEIELAMKEHFPPVRIVFEGQTVLVEDGPASAPDLRIEGELHDLVGLLVTPLLGGLPSPVNARGRAALGLVAQRRVKVTGRLGLLRQWLAVVRI
jgi:hypothetical protein